MYRCPITAPCVTRTGTYGTGGASQRGCIGLHLILYSIHNTATYRRCARSHTNTSPVKKLAPLTTRSSQRSVSAAECHTAEQYSKPGKAKPPNISQEAVYHGILARTSSRYQAVENLLWNQSEDASQKSSWNQMSLPI